MRNTIRAAALSLFLPSALLAPAAAVGMGFGGDSDDAATYKMGYEKAMDGEYSEAIEVLKKVVKESPDNADAWNMLGFSYRNIGDADNAWDAYERTLAIEPNHKGAHEYIGEWYLMQGDIASAKAQLDKLAALCPDGCEEYDTLAASIEDASNS